ncbi:MAG: hypothetical protein M3270_09745 [Thermoproteota archaeon]|nr:hypothetical protein [Thermoproteota archaeon]
MYISKTTLIKSDVMLVLHILKILIILEKYTIAMGGVVDEIALEIEHATPAAIIGGIRLTPAPIAKAVVSGQVITSDAALEAAYFLLQWFQMFGVILYSRRS